jgi:hypothetical protein
MGMGPATPRCKMKMFWVITEGHEFEEILGMVME